MRNNPAATPANLSLGEKAAYGVGDIGFNIIFQATNAYLFFFYTDIFGISAGAAGTILFLARIWDAVTDPAMGIIADRTQTRIGKFRPFLIWGSVPFGLSGALLFLTPSFSEVGNLAYASFAYLLAMTVFTAAGVPYAALLAVLSPNSQQRTDASSARFFFAPLAGTVFHASFFPLVNLFGADGGNPQTGYFWTMVVFGSVAAGALFICGACTRERVAPEPPQARSLKRDLSSLVRNIPWWMLFAISLIALSSYAIRGSVSVHFFKYYFGEAEISGPYNAVGQAVFLVGAISTGFLTRWVGSKKTLFAFLLFTNVITNGLFWFIQPGDYIFLYTLHAAGSFLNGPIFPLIWSMYADAADYGEWKDGFRATGLVVSAAVFAQKLGGALGSAASGWLLQWVGFQSNVEQSEEAVGSMRILMSLAPAIVSLLGVLLTLFYPLSGAKITRIEHDLSLRRSAR